MNISNTENILSKIVLILLIIYSAYGISAVFFNIYSMPFLGVILISAGGVAVYSTIQETKNITTEGKIPTSLILSLILLLSFLISIFLQIMFGDDTRDHLDRSALEFTREIYYLGVCWTFCGAAVQRIKNPKIEYISIYLLAFLCIAIFKNLDGGTVIAYSELTDARSDGLGVDHLFVGESAMMLLLLVYSSVRSNWRMAVVFFSIVVLFSLGGRSALFIYILTIGIYMFLQNSNQKIWQYITGAIILSLIWVVGAVAIDFNNEDTARMLIFDGLIADASIEARQIQFEVGVAALGNQILMGNPSFLIYKFDSMGTYIHNILSIWQLFGLAPFILFSISLAWITKYIFYSRKILTSSIDIFGMLIFFYSLISILTTKHIGFSMIWFSIGFWLIRIAGSQSYHSNKNSTK